MCDRCNCCHVPDHGACDTFVAGRNGRCVYCDHAEECHPGQGAEFNLVLGIGQRSEGQRLAMQLCYAVSTVFAEAMRPAAAAARRAAEMFSCHMLTGAREAVLLAKLSVLLGQPAHEVKAEILEWMKTHPGSLMDWIEYGISQAAEGLPAPWKR